MLKKLKKQKRRTGRFDPPPNKNITYTSRKISPNRSFFIYTTFHNYESVPRKYYIYVVTHNFTSNLYYMHLLQVYYLYNSSSRITLCPAHLSTALQRPYLPTPTLKLISQFRGSARAAFQYLQYRFSRPLSF